MPELLTRTDGMYSVPKQTAEMREIAQGCKPNNDAAERAFGRAQGHRRHLGSVSTGGIEALSMAAGNRDWIVGEAAGKYKRAVGGKRAAVPAGGGFSMIPALQAAVVKLTREADVKGARLALEQQRDQHEARRTREKKEKQTAADVKAARDTIYFHSIERVASLHELDRAVRRRNAGDKDKLLLEQTKQRMVGCGLGGAYSFGPIVLYSAEKAEPKRMALFRQLQRMIREEATNGALKTPEEPQLPARGPADKPQLGDKTAARREHEKAAAERAAARLDREDDPELVALDEAYKGKTFYDADCGECRFIENIEWNEPADRFEAVTVKVYKPGHASAGSR